MENLILDYQKDSKQLRFGLKVHAEMLHDDDHQVFRTWILVDGEKKGDAKILHLKSHWDAKKYVDSFICDVEEQEAKI